MATAPTMTAAPARNLAAAHQMVRSPLEKLRGYIRRYVSLEGAIVVGLYLALWFWIGLVLDWGFFKLFGIDWVQELPWSFRATVLCLLLAGLLAAVATTVLTRLFREFRDVALALLLERRFPEQLGDRLITAVELSDPRQAAAYGFSPAMVQATIHDAASRVATLPVQQVFDWRRLRRRGLRLLLLTAGLYLVVGASFTTVASIDQGQFTTTGFGDFNEVAVLWFERNVLLQNVIWPRRSHLELVDFPANGEIKVGRGATPPTIRARAFKFVISGAPTASARNAYSDWLKNRSLPQEAAVTAFGKVPDEGWRPISWFDLTPALLGAEVPKVNLPAEWVPRNLEAGMTLDEIELRLARAETHQTLRAETHAALRDVIEKLELRGKDPALRRTLRTLIVPVEAILVYKGRTTNGRTTLQRVGDNEYTGQFGELKESVSFTVEGEDYSTPTRKVIVVEPPALETLTRIEERPAYLYYRPYPGSDPRQLRGKKQLMDETNVSLQGGEVSRIDLPAGTNIILTANASKDLKSARIVPKVKKDAVAPPAPPVEVLGDRSFRTRLENVRQEQAYTFEFVDTDGVLGTRQIIIVPAEDSPPKVRELGPDDVVRKVKEGYMVAVTARVPFKGKVHDDYGLSALRYVYSIRRLESRMPAEDRLIAREGTAMIGLFAPTGQGIYSGLGRAVYVLEMAAKVREMRDRPAEVKSFDLPRFDKLLREKKDELIPLALVEEKLNVRQRPPYRALVSEFEIKPDEWTKAETDPLNCDFPLFRENLKVTDVRLTQPRYQVDLRLEAVDTDLDGAADKDGRPLPHIKASDERFPLIVVSENELLSEIAKEEEKLYGDLESAFNKIIETEAKLITVGQDLSGSRVKQEDLGPMAIRCEQVQEVLEKSQVAVRDVTVAYNKILRELRFNQVREDMIERVESKIVRPLGEADSLFEKARDGVLAFKRSLESTEGPLETRLVTARLASDVAKQQLRALIDHLNNILSSMQGLTDINKLIKILADIEKDENIQYDTIEKIKNDLENKIFEDTKPPDKPKDKPKKPGEK